MRVIVQVRPPESTYTMGVTTVMTDVLDTEPLAATGFELDAAYSPVIAPRPHPAVAEMQLATFSYEHSLELEPQVASALIRGTLPSDDQEGVALAALRKRPEVVGVFADPQIEPVITCGPDPVGTEADVAGHLQCGLLAADGLSGAAVPVAVVDKGINADHLTGKGRANPIDADHSFTPVGVTTQPGAHPKDHGTMCAYDVGIAAPQATLLDHAVLLSQAQGESGMAGLLSDAVRSYGQLADFLNGQPGESRRLVVNNSWGMFSPASDFPAGDDGNYSDNPRHPFNLIVATLQDAGADILFAAGNCGRDCPDSRCEFQSLPICGANSHPDVVSVAGIDVRQERVGYSSQGPGRLAREKPDISAYTHFAGSGVKGADSGTSAACPVLAGVVAAVRTQFSSSEVSPKQLRTLLAQTALDLGPVGYDYDYGWGAVDVSALVAALKQAPQPAP